eukprot:8617-Heterococcus_DN1.PRE.1
MLQITRHLSPNEQKIIVPWIKHAPEKIARRLKVFGPYWAGCFLMIYGTMYGSTCATRRRCAVGLSVRLQFGSQHAERHFEQVSVLNGTV